METSPNFLEPEPLGHQGGKSTGGINKSLRVLYLTGLVDSINYKVLYEGLNSFGDIERIKLIFKECDYDGYVTFRNHSEALVALESLNNGKLTFSAKTKLISYSNVLDEECDFVPSICCKPTTQITRRDPPLPVWHVATYKPGRENRYRAAQELQSHIGIIPKNNLKNYGRSLLIKAEHRTQAKLLMKYNPEVEDHIASITPHRTFNLCRGVIYSRDLYDFSEGEILSLCPGIVQSVKKLGGRNNSILLNFNGTFLPDFIDVMHTRLNVKKYYQRPTQCFNCLEYGHVVGKCINTKKCSNCSGVHDFSQECVEDTHCFLCGGDHCPNSRNCPRFKFEQEVLMVAENEFLSIGSAKYKVMGANKSQNSTYVSVVNRMRANKAKSHHERVTASRNPPHPLSMSKDALNSSNGVIETSASARSKSLERAQSSQDMSTAPSNERKSQNPLNKPENKNKVTPQSGTIPKKCHEDSDSDDNKAPAKKMKGHDNPNKSMVRDTPTEIVEDMLHLSNSFLPLDSMECELESQKDITSAAASQNPSQNSPTNERDISDTVEHLHNKLGEIHTPQLIQKDGNHPIPKNSNNPKPPKPKKSNIPRIQRSNKNKDNNQHHNSSKGIPADHTAGKK